MKRCTKCFVWKQPSLFWKDKKGKDGLSSRCADCGITYQHNNRARYNELGRIWRKKHPERRKEQIKRAVLKFKLHNPESLYDIKKRSRILHPISKEALIRYRNRRRALKRGAFIETVDKFTVWLRDKGICQLGNSDRCWYWLPANPSTWHLEHKISLANKGEHSYANTRASCPPCNQEKYTKAP